MFYTLEITLQGRKPKNNRIIEIQDSLTFEEFAWHICRLFGFHGEHLREFRKEDKLTINHPLYTIDELPNQEDLMDPDFEDLQWFATQVSATNYRLSDYFINNTKIEFIYDFGENRKFDIDFKKVDEINHYKKPVNVISGTWCYLMDDSGGPLGLREYLDQYARQQRDGEERETYDDFSEWIQPATRQFHMKNHPEYS